MDKVISVLKEYLSSDDLSKVEESLKDIIDKRVSVLVSEKTNKIEEASQEYIEKMVDEEVSKIKETLEEDFRQKDAELKEQLGDFLDAEINENISDELLKNIAAKETFMPIVEGIKRVFSENSISLDVDASYEIEKLKSQISEKELSISESIEKRIETEKNLAEVSKRLLISEKVKGLSDGQSEKVKSLFESKDFDTVYDEIDTYIDVLIEKENSSDGNKVLKEDDGIEDEKIIEENSTEFDVFADKLTNF